MDQRLMNMDIGIDKLNETELLQFWNDVAETIIRL